MHGIYIMVTKTFKYIQIYKVKEPDDKIASLPTTTSTTTTTTTTSTTTTPTTTSPSYQENFNFTLDGKNTTEEQV